ncbi:NUDIX domain-containing protein [Streptomyces sp. NPDC002851]
MTHASIRRAGWAEGPELSARPAFEDKSRKGSHCSSCGAPYAVTDGWPRTCPACGDTAYRNPLPVAVALLPVLPERPGEQPGLVVVVRAIAPARGRLALPGGYLDDGEDWRSAVVRELFEETGIAAPATEVRLADALSAPNGHLLLFGLLSPRHPRDLPPSTPTPETTGYQIQRTPATLGFPLRTQALHAWFEGRYEGR